MVVNLVELSTHFLYCAFLREFVEHMPHTIMIRGGQDISLSFSKFPRKTLQPDGDMLGVILLTRQEHTPEVDIAPLA